MELALRERLRDLHGPILITGHTGFKGMWLTLLLENLGVPAIGYSLAPESGSLFDRAARTGAIPEDFDDIRDFVRFSEFIHQQQPSAVIHMAAQPLVLESYKSPRATFETNVMGTVNLLDAAFACSQIKAVIVVTTDKVYRNDNSGKAFIESDPLSGKDPYSASKVGTEAAVAAWQQIAKISGGPKVASVRAGNVIGGGDWAADRLLPDIVKSFSAGNRLTVRNSDSTRPWQHVLDPLHGYLQLLVSMLDESGAPAINFGPESKSLSVFEVVEIAKDRWPGKTDVEFISNSNSGGAEAQSLQLDSGLARKSLNWNSRWTQEDAVRATVDWWSKVINEKVDPTVACRSDIDHLLGN